MLYFMNIERFETISIHNTGTAMDLEIFIKQFLFLIQEENYWNNNRFFFSSMENTPNKDMIQMKYFLPQILIKETKIVSNDSITPYDLCVVGKKIKFKDTSAIVKVFNHSRQEFVDLTKNDYKTIINLLSYDDDSHGKWITDCLSSQARDGVTYSEI